MKDHKEIWLEPACCQIDKNNRMWATKDDGLWIHEYECSNGLPPTRYIRADLVPDRKELLDMLEQAEKKLAAWGLSDISDKESFDQAQGWRQRALEAEQELKETVEESGANYRNFKRFYALYFTSKGKLEAAEQEIKDLKHDLNQYMDINKDLLNIDIPALEASHKEAVNRHGKTLQRAYEAEETIAHIIEALAHTNPKRPSLVLRKIRALIGVK